MRFSFQDIHCLLTLLDSATRTEASARLDITISALTRAVQRVEAEFGLPLLAYRARGVRLTKAGQGLVASLQRMSAEYFQAHLSIANAPDHEMGDRCGLERGIVSDGMEAHGGFFAARAPSSHCLLD
jgi:DNA-binding transcriptional LysR family regulator